MPEIINLDDDSDENGYNYYNAIENYTEQLSTHCENGVQSNPILSINCGGHGCVGGIINGNVVICGGYTDMALQESLIFKNSFHMKEHSDNKIAIDIVVIWLLTLYPLLCKMFYLFSLS